MRKKYEEKKRQTLKEHILKTAGPIQFKFGMEEMSHMHPEEYFTEKKGYFYLDVTVVQMHKNTIVFSWFP